MTTTPASIGAPFQSGSDALRWVESPADVGLRFVGYADEMVRLGHTGWYCDEFQDRTLRGVVYQLPGRKGRARYVYGYTSSDDIRRKGADPDSAALALADVTERPATEEQDDTRNDVARRADSCAEHAAEKERDYQAAWRAGSYFSDTAEQVAALEEERRGLLAELRAMTPACKKTHPVAFRAAESRLQAVRAGIADSREKLHKLVTGEPTTRDDNGWYPTRDHAAAFMDGAGVASVRKLPRFAREVLSPYLNK